MSEVIEHELSDHFGRKTAAMVNEVFDSGVDRAVLLMRHSAREFNREINDLLNPLTEHGRALCSSLGRALPKDVNVKGYASPPERCMETAKIVIGAHTDDGGMGGRTRPVEGLGVFYSLDQMKMWMVLRECEGLADYVSRWVNGEVPSDAVMPAELATDMILRVLTSKLAADGAERQLDLCVSHDMTICMVRHQVGLEPAHGPTVEFLDGLILFEREGELRLASHHGGEVTVSS